MKKLFLVLLVFASTNAFAKNVGFIPFYGAGKCMIRSQPCDDGHQVSCQAWGNMGGYCSAERSGRYVTLTCVANGTSMYSESCRLRR